MVNFASMMDDDAASLSLDPLEIFDQLPKSKGISNLYDSQASILRTWYEGMREKRDVIIELNTGGGKTLIGLLIALSTMHETEMGVLYLVENRQLVGQVVSQGKELGISIRAYTGRESLDAAFDNGECIVVGSYQALFNGRSVFGVMGGGNFQAVGGIIVDDAHASLDAVRDVFSLSIPANSSSSLYRAMLSEFRTTFESLELETTYHDFYSGVGGIANDHVIEIPFWEWAEVQSRVASIISNEYSRCMTVNDDLSSALKFCWPLIKDSLKYCQVTVSRRAITIAALYPLVHLFPTFTSAKRRVFMSATFTDYGDMVRAYDLRDLSNESLIAPKTPAGIGRRMILPLVSEVADSKAFSRLIDEEVNYGHGVVRLVPHAGIDEEWDHPEMVEPVGHEQVEHVVDELRNDRCRKMVSFVNRYNGIDLPDDSCRVLIMRDLPIGRNDTEELMACYLSHSSINTQRIAQRIEQGIGRGVRSGSDHCVVLLEGNSLIDWVDRKRNKQHFSAALRAQLDMGGKAYASITNADEYCEAIRQDLLSEDSWKSYHSKMLSNAIKHANEKKDSFGVSFKIACAERRAFACWREHQMGAGVSKLEKALKHNVVDEQLCGWLLQLAARICFDGDTQNANAANALQRQAHSTNTSIPYYPFTSLASNDGPTMMQADALMGMLLKENKGKGVLSVFDTRVANLTAESPAGLFEESLVELGRFLGFVAEKHDRNGVGSDVTWISPDGIGFVLEAKSEKKPEVPFHKGEAGQLRTSRDWFEGLHPELNVLPVSVHPNNKADKNASASNLYVLTLANLDNLKEEVRRLVEKASTCLPTRNSVELQDYILKFGLDGRRIMDSYLVRFNTPLD